MLYMKKEFIMATRTVFIKASSNVKEIKLPSEFLGKDVVVSFSVDENSVKPVNPKSLLGIINIPKQTLQELREERLNIV